MKAKELKGKSISELKALLHGLYKDLEGFRFEISESKLKDIKKIAKTKKDIARINTIIQIYEKNPKNP